MLSQGIDINDIDAKVLQEKQGNRNNTQNTGSHMPVEKIGTSSEGLPMSIANKKCIDSTAEAKEAIVEHTATKLPADIDGQFPGRIALLQWVGEPWKDTGTEHKSARNHRKNTRLRQQERSSMKCTVWQFSRSKHTIISFHHIKESDLLVGPSI
jgi:hypothetical protein